MKLNKKKCQNGRRESVLWMSDKGEFQPWGVLEQIALLPMVLS